MIKLALDPTLVLTDLRMWRDAMLMTRRRSPPRASEPRMLAADLSGTAERVDGFLMLLESCSAAPEHAHEFAQLVAQLREFKDWVQQAQYAAQVLQSLSPAATKKRTAAHAR